MLQNKVLGTWNLLMQKSGFPRICTSLSQVFANWFTYVCKQIKYHIRSNFQMTKLSKKSANKDFENNIFENESVIQLAVIC